MTIIHEKCFRFKYQLKQITHNLRKMLIKSCQNFKTLDSSFHEKQHFETNKSGWVYFLEKAVFDLLVFAHYWEIQIRCFWWNYFWINSVCLTFCWEQIDVMYYSQLLHNHRLDRTPALSPHQPVPLSSFFGGLPECLFSEETCSSTTFFVLLPYGVSIGFFFWTYLPLFSLDFSTCQLDFFLFWSMNILSSSILFRVCGCFLFFFRCFESWLRWISYS